MSSMTPAEKIIQDMEPVGTVTHLQKPPQTLLLVIAGLILLFILYILTDKKKCNDNSDCMNSQYCRPLEEGGGVCEYKYTPPAPIPVIPAPIPVIPAPIPVIPAPAPVPAPIPVIPAPAPVILAPAPSIQYYSGPAPDFMEGIQRTRSYTVSPEILGPFFPPFINSNSIIGNGTLSLVNNNGVASFSDTNRTALQTSTGIRPDEFYIIDPNFGDLSAKFLLDDRVVIADFKPNTSDLSVELNLVTDKRLFKPPLTSGYSPKAVMIGLSFSNIKELFVTTDTFKGSPLLKFFDNDEFELDNQLDSQPNLDNAVFDAELLFGEDPNTTSNARLKTFWDNLEVLS